MSRNVVAATVACLYLALSATLVTSMGRAHRDELKQSRRPKAIPVSSSISTPSVNEHQEISPDTVQPSRSEQSAPKAAPQTAPIALPGLPPSGPSRAKPIERSAPPVPVLLPPTDISKPAFATADAAKPATPRLDDLDPFFGLPQAKRIWDVGNLTAEQEVELGRVLNEMVLLPRFNHRLKTGALERRLAEAAEPLRASVSRKEIVYKFIILDSQAINAFSHPGGYVYITRGLLDWISEDENYALQFALAHEIYHVDQRHALKCLQDPGVRGLRYGTLALFYLFIFPRGYYPEQMDFDADAWALRQLQQIGYTPRERLAFIRKWQRYAEENDFLTDRGQPQSGEVASLFDNHYRAHPSALTRLKKLELLADGPHAKTR